MSEPVTVLPRSIGTFTANVTIEEEHADDLTITEHPVEQGAAITDHAYKNPSQVTMRVGYSNSSVEADGDPGYVAEVYQQFLDLQATREPFGVVTGKRVYTNMLIKSLGVTTDQATENALMMTVTCREVIIVQTQTTTLPPTENQADPSKTAATQNTGQKQPASATAANGAAMARAMTAFFK